jgi:hypothetical protein
VPEVPDAQTLPADSAETAVDLLAISAVVPAAGSGIAGAAHDGTSSPEALAQSARAEQSSLQRPITDELSRIERARRQLAPRSFWPGRSR